MVQWLRHCTSTSGPWVQSLVREVLCAMERGQRKIKKKTRKRWTKDLNVRANTMKLLEGNIRENLDYFGHGLRNKWCIS